MRRAILAACLLAIASSGCWQTPSVFEKRYVRIEIPGYAAKNYLQLLDSDNPDLRYLALSNLIEDKLTEGETVSKKLGVLLQDASPKVRALAAFSVKSLNVDTYEANVLQLLNDPSADVRLEAVAALEKHCGSSDRATAAIVNRLEDHNLFVRLQTIDTLSRCEMSPARMELVHRLLAELPQRVQLEQLMIINALGSLGQVGEVESALLPLLSSGEDPVITAAAKALGRLKATSAVQPLCGAIQQKRGDAEVIVRALGTIGTPEAVHALLQLLDAVDDELRVTAIKAIGKTGGNAGLAELVERLAQQETRMQREVDTVKWADIKTNYPELTATLEAIERKCFGDSNKFAEPPMAQLLASEKDYEKLIALRILAEGEPYDRLIVAPTEKKPDWFPLLGLLCRDPAPPMRVFALQALGNTVDSRTPVLLAAAVNDPSFGIRYAAIQALGRYAQNTGDYSPLSRLYEMRDSFVPSTYTNDDKGFLIRALIDTTLAGAERPEVTRRRRVAELSSSSKPTRLVAALQLGDDTALPVFFEFLETGTAAEKQAVLNNVERCLLLAPSADTVSKLRALKAKEQDIEVSKKISRLIEKLQEKLQGTFRE